MNPMLLPPVIAEIFQHLSDREIVQVLTVNKEWARTGQMILRPSKIIHLMLPYLSKQDLLNLRLTCRRLSRECLKIIISRRRSPMSLNSDDQIRAFVEKCISVSPELFPNLELTTWIQMKDTNPVVMELFNTVGPHIEELSLRRTKWDWKTLSLVLFEKLPKLRVLRIEYGILPKPDNPFQNEFLLNKRPLLCLKKLTFDLNILTPKNEPREGVRKFFKELFSVTPNLEVCHADIANRAVRSFVHDILMQYYPSLLPRLRSMHTIMDYTPNQLKVIQEKKELFKILSLRIEPPTQITPEILLNFLQDMSSTVTTLDLIFIAQPISMCVFPTQHSFGANLSHLILFGWKSSLNFIKELHIVKTIMFRDLSLAETLFLNSTEPEADTVEFYTMFCDLKHLERLCFSKCEESERITIEMFESLPKIKIGVFDNFQDAATFFYPRVRTRHLN